MVKHQAQSSKQAIEDDYLIVMYIDKQPYVQCRDSIQTVEKYEINKKIRIKILQYSRYDLSYRNTEAKYFYFISAYVYCEYISLSMGNLSAYNYELFVSKILFIYVY